jgi:hypothetical protein
LRRVNDIVFLLDKQSIHVKLKWTNKSHPVEQSNNFFIRIMFETRDFRNSVNVLFAFFFEAIAFKNINFSIFLGRRVLFPNYLTFVCRCNKTSWLLCSEPQLEAKSCWIWFWKIPLFVEEGVRVRFQGRTRQAKFVVCVVAIVLHVLWAQIPQPAPSQAAGIYFSFTNHKTYLCVGKGWEWRANRNKAGNVLIYMRNRYPALCHSKSNG